jgi:hypothetical protein
MPANNPLAYRADDGGEVLRPETFQGSDPLMALIKRVLASGDMSAPASMAPRVDLPVGGNVPQQDGFDAAMNTAVNQGQAAPLTPVQMEPMTVGNSMMAAQSYREGGSKRAGTGPNNINPGKVAENVPLPTEKPSAYLNNGKFTRTDRAEIGGSSLAQPTAVSGAERFGNAVVDASRGDFAGAGNATMDAMKRNIQSRGQRSVGDMAMTALGGLGPAGAVMGTAGRLGKAGTEAMAGMQNPAVRSVSPAGYEALLQDLRNMLTFGRDTGKGATTQFNAATKGLAPAETGIIGSDLGAQSLIQKILGSRLSQKLANVGSMTGQATGMAGASNPGMRPPELR